MTGRAVPGGGALRRLVPKTLRIRLILGLVAVLAALCVGVGAATTTALRHFQIGQVDRQLTDAGGRYAASLEHAADTQAGTQAGTRAGLQSAEGHTDDTRAQTPGTFGARLLGGRATTAGLVDGDADDFTESTSTGNTAGTAGTSNTTNTTGDTDDHVQLTAADQRALASLVPDGPARTYHLDPLGEYRVRAFPGQDGDVLVTGLPLKPVDKTLHQLIEVELAVFAAALAAAAVIGAGWVRLALRPLDRVTRTAERVSSLSLASGEVALSVRVPDDDPATEVGRVGASLNRMLGHVEDALGKRHAVEERLREFAADASHELRTPVSTVRGHAELALRHPEPIPDAVRHALVRIESESQRMGVIVEDLLLLARLDAGRPLVRQEVDLTRLALDAVDDARAAGPGHRWRLDLPEEPAVATGDGGRLAQAVANLLANARKHTPDGTEVTLRLAVDAGPDADADPGCVEITVTDTGPGLDPELAGRAFDRFVRGDKARSRASGSTGLGLAITRAIVEAHGGAVTLATSPGHTVFSIVIPRGGGAGPGAGADLTPPRSAEGTTPPESAAD